YSSLEEIVQRKKTGLFSNLLILDEVQDPQHLGALIRSAACFGFQGVIISESHASQVGPAAAKAASGAIEYIPLARVSSIAKAIDFLKENSFWSFGAAAEAQKSIYNQDVKSNVALVIGSEGKGLRRLVREKCDFLVSIPISGPISSLSASAAGTVLMADIARQQNS
ncbi:MAG: 23S rRNA (guanosine(2251)-2'-O)-methyltransferase RlmB, partial [bacterium]|nr:23S rRNA (guanosine(2251)-2'-O)-methyltransferase RlmB [bacterium]